MIRCQVCKMPLMHVENCPNLGQPIGKRFKVVSRGGAGVVALISAHTPKAASTIASKHKKSDANFAVREITGEEFAELSKTVKLKWEEV